MKLKLAAVSDIVLCPEHGTTEIVEGANFIRRLGKPVARVGDATSCGAVISSGADWWRIEGKAVAREGDTTNHGGIILPTEGLVTLQDASPINPQLLARKGTIFFGGAGMSGDYIAHMVQALEAVGVTGAFAANAWRWSLGMHLDASVGVFRYRYGDDLTSDMGIDDYGTVGPQFNLIGYSFGSVVAAQVAIKYAK